MKPLVQIKRRPEAVIGAVASRFGFSLRWNDPPFWRWPRVEFHHEDGARGVVIGWRLTGLALMVLDR